VGVFLVDDVQFISNKEQTQEAFFHIFNSLYESHKQLVFSSDLYPADIKGLAERLSSRFEWGLVTDIQMPTTETKIAILKHKADLHNECLPDEVAHFIAARVLSNVRELEGSLIRIMAYAALTKQHITIDLAKKILVRAHDVQVKPIDFDHIIKVICSYYPYTITDLRSDSRNKQLSLVRQIAMYCMKTMTHKSLHEIGHFLGRKDHTTVLHAVQKIKVRIQNDPSFAVHMKKIEEDVLGQ
jgi:chromosomal replication initiator protein